LLLLRVCLCSVPFYVESLLKSKSVALVDAIQTQYPNDQAVPHEAAVNIWSTDARFCVTARNKTPLTIRLTINRPEEQFEINIFTVNCNSKPLSKKG
jgi:hypothetical protein